MKLVKEIKKDRFTLTHSWYVDDWGLKRNMFELFDNTDRVHMPFLGDIRVSNTSTGQAFLGDDTSPYSDQEYGKMLDEQIEKYRHYKQ